MDNHMAAALSFVDSIDFDEIGDWRALAKAYLFNTSYEDRKKLFEFLIFDQLTSYPMIGSVLSEVDERSYVLMGELAERIVALSVEQEQMEWGVESTYASWLHDTAKLDKEIRGEKRKSDACPF